MTLEEALKLIGVAIIMSLMRLPGHEGVSFHLYNAVVEEWLDGNLDIDQDKLTETLSAYGVNSFKQAARIIANKVNIYGDVE